MSRNSIRGGILSLVIFMVPVLSLANVTLEWDEVLLDINLGTESIQGYRIYYGQVSGAYSDSVFAGDVTTYTFPTNVLAPDELYFFAATAIDLAGNESGVSNEVSARTDPLPTPTPTPTATPTPTVTPAPSPSPTPTPTATPTPTGTPMPSPTPTATPTPTVTPAPSPSPTPTPTATPTPTGTPMPSPTPTPMPTATATPTATPSASPTPSPTGIPTIPPNPSGDPVPEQTSQPSTAENSSASNRVTSVSSGCGRANSGGNKSVGLFVLMFAFFVSKRSSRSRRRQTS